MVCYYVVLLYLLLTWCYVVRLGKSGLKVSRIILGCMTYGSQEWESWLLDEEEGLKHIKTAYVILSWSLDPKFNLLE